MTTQKNTFIEVYILYVLLHLFEMQSVLYNQYDSQQQKV